MLEASDAIIAVIAEQPADFACLCIVVHGKPAASSIAAFGTANCAAVVLIVQAFLILFRFYSIAPAQNGSPAVQAPSRGARRTFSGLCCNFCAALFATAERVRLTLSRGKHALVYVELVYWLAHFATIANFEFRQHNVSLT
jgi:sulfite reductase alpha subunit-like flavoprotein